MIEIYITFIPDESPFNLTLTEIICNLRGFYSDGCKIVICREVASKEHYHIYITIPKYDLYPDSVRKQIKRDLRTFLNGEIRMSHRGVEDKIRAIAYTIKDSNYKCYNIDWNDLLKAKEITHKKEDKSWKALTKKFYENEDFSKDEDIVRAAIEIHKKCNIPFGVDKIEKMVRLKKLKSQSGNEYETRVIREVLDRI